MKVMDELRRLYGGRFSVVFKTITADNGSEFAGTYVPTPVRVTSKPRAA